MNPVPALKRQLADELLRAIGELPQNFAAAKIYCTQSRISDLRHGRLETMSLERMIEMLSHTRRVIEIKIHPPPRVGRPGGGPHGAQLSRTG